MTVRALHRAADAKTPITGIDTHAHVFSQALPLAEQRRYAPCYDAPLERYLAELDAHGVSHGVLVQPSFLGTDNSYLLKAIAAEPERLRGIAVIDPTEVAATPGQLDAMAQRGIVGIRLNLFARPDPDFSSTAWRATLPKIAELGWQIEVHCEAERLRRVVGPLIERSQNAIAIVVDHFGRPDPLLGIDDPGFRYLLTLGATRRVWVKVSGAYRNGTELGARSGESIAHAAMPLLIAAFGLDRLVWGSDWPHTQFEHRTSFGAAHRLLLELLPSKDGQQKVLVDTAAQLFKIGGSRPLWQGSACLR